MRKSLKLSVRVEFQAGRVLPGKWLFIHPCADAKMAGKGAGSGRVEGVERQMGKNQDCQTSMSITLRPCKVEHCEGQCF